MTVLHCECGFTAAGHTDDELVASAQAHARERHGIEMPAQLVVDLTVPLRAKQDPARRGERERCGRDEGS